MNSLRQTGFYDKMSPYPQRKLFKGVSLSANRTEAKCQHSFRRVRSPTQSRLGRSPERRTQARSNPPGHYTDGSFNSVSHSDRGRPVSMHNCPAFRTKCNSYSPMPRSSSTERKGPCEKEPPRPVYGTHDARYGNERRPRSRSPLHPPRSRSGRSSREPRSSSYECTDFEKVQIKRKRCHVNTDAFSDNLWSSVYEMKVSRHETYSSEDKKSVVKSPPEVGLHELIGKPATVSSRRRKPSRWSDEKVDLSKLGMLNAAAKTVSVTEDTTSGQKIATAKNFPEKAKVGNVINGQTEKSAANVCHSWIDSAPWMHKKQGAVKSAVTQSGKGVQDDPGAKVVCSSSGSFPASTKSSLPSSGDECNDSRRDIKPKTSVASMTSVARPTLHTSSIPHGIQLVSSLGKAGLSLDPCTCAMTEAENLRSLRLSRFLQESLGSCGSVTSYSSSQSNAGEITSDDSSPALLPPSGMPLLPAIDLPTSNSDSDTSKYRLGVKHTGTTLPVNLPSLPVTSSHVFVNMGKPNHPVLPALMSPDKIPSRLHPPLPLHICPTAVNGHTSLPNPVNAARPTLPIGAPNIVPPVLFPHIPPPSLPGNVADLRNNLDVSLKQNQLLNQTNLDISLKNHVLSPQILLGLLNRHILTGVPPMAISGLPNVPGLQGLQGLQGLHGLQGLQALQALQGLHGLQGLQGLQELQGLQRLQGMTDSIHIPPPVSIANTNCVRPSLITMPSVRPPSSSISPSGAPRINPPVAPASEKKNTLPSVTNKTEDDEKELVKTVFVPVFYNPSVPPPLF